MSGLDPFRWSILILVCLTLGLSPISSPHLWQKLVMLFHGGLVRPLDLFDALMHGAPWVLLVLKEVRHLAR